MVISSNAILEMIQDKLICIDKSSFICFYCTGNLHKGWNIYLADFGMPVQKAYIADAQWRRCLGH